MKSFQLLIAVFFLFVSVSVVFAAPMPPQPSCSIVAQVIDTNVTHDPSTELAKEQGVGESSSGWSIIKILNHSTAPQTDVVSRCEQMYELEREIFLRLNPSFEVGTILDGVITLSGDEWSSAYSLNNITVVSNLSVTPVNVNIDEESTVVSDPVTIAEVVSTNVQEASSPTGIYWVFALLLVFSVSLVFFLIQKKRK